EVIPGSALSPFTATATSAKLTGTVIGTTGSWSGTTSDDKSKAFDGSLSTFFDAPTSVGWAGLDFGSNKTLSQVKYAPRSGWASRMTGGKIQGSTTADFSSGVTDLFTISGTPTVGVLTSQTISGSYRYVRYLSPTGGYGNIAELEFWGK
ncbi:MAG: discoidin domain-containing protein, partial [Aeromicrobium sp.]|nr:discoidin domain-containing protein [Burkholderiales bacterium]